MAHFQVGRLWVEMSADRPRTCGIHGDDTTSGRCPKCDEERDRERAEKDELDRKLRREGKIR